MRKALTIVLAGIGVCLIAGQRVDAAPGDGIDGTHLAYDFGCVGMDFDIYHTFRLTNNGLDTVRVSEVIANCDCSHVMFLDSTLYPGDTVDLRLQFNTEDYYGPSTRKIVVKSNDRHQPEMKLFYFSTVGQWLHRIVPKPVSLFFLGAKGPKELLVSNQGVDRVEVREIDIADDIVAVETVTEAAVRGDNIKLKVSPKPDLTAGTHQTSFRLTLAVSETEKPLYLTIPVKIVKY